MKQLWPYYSTDKKAFWRDGSKIFSLTKIDDKTFKYAGDKINKTLLWNVFYTINLSEVIFIK